MKTPTQRAIEVLIRSKKQGEALMDGTVYANDYGDAVSTHAIGGRLVDRQGAEYTVSGLLSGFVFVPTETRGRPRKVGRDEALWMAFRWYLADSGTEADAREKVMSLWEAKDWRGIGTSDRTHMNKKLRDTEKRMLTDGHSLIFYHTTDKLDGVVIAMNRSAFDTVTPQQLSGAGEGWVWRFGTERADYGSWRFGRPLEGKET